MTRFTRILGTLTLVLAIIALTLALMLRSANARLEAALGIRAARSVEKQLEQRNEEMMAGFVDRLDRAKAAWEDLMWQEARLDVKKKHEASSYNLRMLATGLGSYQVDYNFYPMGLSYLEPGYSPKLVAVDGWRNDVRYTILNKQRSSYLIQAPGQDGEFDTADDYKLQDGALVHSPDVSSLCVEPLALPQPEHRLDPPAGDKPARP